MKVALYLQEDAMSLIQSSYRRLAMFHPSAQIYNQVQEQETCLASGEPECFSDFVQSKGDNFC